MPVDIKTLIQNRVIALAGQALDANATPTFDMITLTGTTTQSTDVATKAYVDSEVSSGGGSLAITDDTSTDVTQYLAMSREDSGSMTDVYVASTELSYNPDSGILSAPSIAVSGTGASKLSTGTTAQRPGSATAGQIRFNSDLGVFEGYDGTVWSNVGDLLEKQFTRAGTLSATTGSAYWLIPSNVKIVAIVARLGTAPSGASLIATVKKNGASLATLTFVSDQSTVEDINTYTAVKNDVISVDITQVGTATAGADLNIVFLYERGT